MYLAKNLSGVPPSADQEQANESQSDSVHSTKLSRCVSCLAYGAITIHRSSACDSSDWQGDEIACQSLRGQKSGFTLYTAFNFSKPSSYLPKPEMLHSSFYYPCPSSTNVQIQIIHPDQLVDIFSLHLSGRLADLQRLQMVRCCGSCIRGYSTYHDS